MKCVGVCGHFGMNHIILNGQIVKTKVITQELKNYFGEEEVVIVDTFGWKENPFKLLVACVGLLISCKNILILPANNGVKVLIPLFVVLNVIYKRKIHYSVIGGWLPEFLEDHTKLLKWITKMDTVYVETTSMKEKLNNLGLSNIVLMPNFKNIKVIEKSELIINDREPYRLCTFSRVMKEKGILDAIKAVRSVNKIIGKPAFTLDIYGVIEDEFQADFEKALSENVDCVDYKGFIQFDQSTVVLKDYYALLFPTWYEGEGLPGTIIDAFSAALPVIASNWRYNSEIVEDGKTGLIYELDESGRERGLIKVLKHVRDNPKILLSMKEACLKEAEKYDAAAAMQKMILRLAV